MKSRCKINGLDAYCFGIIFCRKKKSIIFGVALGKRTYFWEYK